MGWAFESSLQAYFSLLKCEHWLRGHAALVREAGRIIRLSEDRLLLRPGERRLIVRPGERWLIVRRRIVPEAFRWCSRYHFLRHRFWLPHRALGFFRSGLFLRDRGLLLHSRVLFLRRRGLLGLYRGRLLLRRFGLLLGRAGLLFRHVWPPDPS